MRRPQEIYIVSDLKNYTCKTSDEFFAHSVRRTSYWTIDLFWLINWFISFLYLLPNLNVKKKNLNLKNPIFFLKQNSRPTWLQSEGSQITTTTLLFILQKIGSKISWVLGNFGAKLIEIGFYWNRISPIPFEQLIYLKVNLFIFILYCMTC